MEFATRHPAATSVPTPLIPTSPGAAVSTGGLARRIDVLLRAKRNQKERPFRLERQSSNVQIGATWSRWDPRKFPVSAASGRSPW